MPPVTANEDSRATWRKTRAAKTSSVGTEPVSCLDDELLVHSFGVGHGDCTLLEFKQDGKVSFRLLCDAGEVSPKSLVEFLEANRREATLHDIDVAVLSHVDDDHQGGFHSLLQNDAISIGEFWGPCLPAFRRLKWLFASRVERAVDRASKLEKMLASRKVPVVYPMEHFTQTAASGAVTLSVISPAPRLIRRLLAASEVAIGDLLTSSPLPLEWLVSETPYEEDSDNVAGMDALFQDRSFLSPHDFPLEGLPEARADRTLLIDAAADRAGAAWEPNFFGNSVLNDTSVVVVVDVLLDTKQRRRVLLCGDQENWSYIAAKHPAGLGVDVLKVPHHGGRVYLGDKSEAMEQMYLWLRPRIAVVSARGRHDLPRNQFRNAVRAVGTTLLCPNTRRIEPITADSGLDDPRSCFDSYECKSSSQRPQTTLRLTGAKESSDAPACVQGMNHRGAAPIVVLEQRLIEPDESFVRWTRTEIEKQARWIRGKLNARHAQFVAAAKTAEEPVFAAMRGTPVPWSQLEAMARAEGHHHLVADPEPVLKLAASRQLVWTTTEHRTRATDGFYLPASEVEIRQVLQWILKMPNILLKVPNFKWAWVEGGNRLAVLDAADMFGLCSVVAGRLFIPREFAERELIPRLKVEMANAFSARACDGADAERHVRSGTDSVLLHLYRDAPSVPDVFDDEWKSQLWNLGYELDGAKIRFLLARAEDGVLVPISKRNHSDNGLTVSQSSFEMFFQQYGRQRNLDRVEVGEFPEAFSRAEWQDMWVAT